MHRHSLHPGGGHSREMSRKVTWAAKVEYLESVLRRQVTNTWLKSGSLALLLQVLPWPRGGCLGLVPRAGFGAGVCGRSHHLQLCPERRTCGFLQEQEDIRLSEDNRAAVSVCAFMGFCFPRVGLILGSWFALGHMAPPSSPACPSSAPHKTTNGWGGFVLVV